MKLPEVDDSAYVTRQFDGSTLKSEAENVNDGSVAGKRSKVGSVMVVTASVVAVEQATLINFFNRKSDCKN